MSERSNGTTLAAVVADQIVGDIAARGWPQGEIIGSEADLLDRYQVSRAVLREAVRLLEHLHVAEMRRGPGGGLHVVAPSVDSVTDAVSVYLYYVGAEIDEVFDARLLLEETAAELAPQRMTETDLAALRGLVDDERTGRLVDPRELHRLVAKASANPALEFFVDLLNRVATLYLPGTPTFAKRTIVASHDAHAAIVDAILAGDGALARRRMDKHLRAEADYLRNRRPSRRRLAELPDVVGRSDKRAEQIARQIFNEVATSGWPVGEVLGSEAEMMARYDISRAVLREAVRVLEHHQVARMRRGPGGGLIVAEPGVEAVTEAVALQVDRLGMTPAHLFELRMAVEMVVLDLAVRSLDAAGEQALEAAQEAERSALPAEFAITGHDLHAVLAHIAGNRVIELLVLVLVRLTRFHASTPDGVVADTAPNAEVMHVHDRIVEAILARDLELARHRMRRHLDALRRWTR
ncbi:MAG TPA: FCD domain-containing protein [Acidimicrobiales bacterium]|jgi:DNA-binding FadR family transcriptional regulator|nr:FCD domain-containing protein [Acidimicrobiales bacterium]